MDDLKTTYNKIAADWQKDHEQDTWWVSGTDAFASLLPAGGKVLDVGCGVGVKTEYLMKKGLQVTATDFSEKMIELARQRVPGAECLVMDMKDMSGLHESFDGVFVQAALLHIPKKEVMDVLRGLKKKLRPGGYLYVAVKELRSGEKEEEVVIESGYGYEYSRFFSYFTPEELRHDFEELGMDVRYENVATSGRRNWAQIIGQA